MNNTDQNIQELWAIIKGVTYAMGRLEGKRIRKKEGLEEIL